MKLDCSQPIDRLAHMIELDVMLSVMGHFAL
jgi:hypothetical protein